MIRSVAAGPRRCWLAILIATAGCGDAPSSRDDADAAAADSAILDGGQYNATGFALDADAVYWTTAGTGADGAVRRADR